MAQESGPLSGVRVCVFETRRGEEMRSLLERQGAQVTLAPSLREVPLENNAAALAFVEQLLAGKIDVVIFLTGVGARALAEVAQTKWAWPEVAAALSNCVLIVRGPKPAAVLREWKLRIDHQVPEPNTWHDLLALLDAQVPLQGKTLAVQEYGQPNDELYAALTQRGAHVVPVPVYRWELPEDTRPLLQGVSDTIAGGFDVLAFTSAQQLHHVLQVADAAGLKEAWLDAANRCLVASIGPTASETLHDQGLRVDVQPEHPKMGHLAQAIAAAVKKSS